MFTNWNDDILQGGSNHLDFYPMSSDCRGSNGGHTKYNCTYDRFADHFEEEVWQIVAWSRDRSPELTDGVKMSLDLHPPVCRPLFCFRLFVSSYEVTECLLLGMLS
jgi:hypothetical protein